MAEVYDRGTTTGAHGRKSMVTLAIALILAAIVIALVIWAVR
jgi:hypothetical protein